MKYKGMDWNEKNLERISGLEPWFIFGQHENGEIDISNGDGDVFESVPPPIANRLISCRARFIRDITAILNGETSTGTEQRP